MLRGPDWTRTRDVVTAFLEPEERPVTLFTALVPPPERGGEIVDVILAPLVWAVWHATWRHSTRAASRAANITLAPRMVIALTPRRMVVWRANRRWRLGTMAGELPRHLIVRGHGAARRNPVPRAGAAAGNRAGCHLEGLASQRRRSGRTALQASR